MSLNYLVFDFSEDTEGIGTFDAMASVSAGHMAAVQADVAQVLGWAFDTFGAEHGPVEEGFVWDYDLQAQIEVTTPERWQFDAGLGLVLTSRGQAGEARHAVNLTLTGNESFCAAFQERFVRE